MAADSWLPAPLRRGRRRRAPSSRAAGGTSVTEVTHLFFGDRIGRVRDPLGNLYWIQTHVEDLSPQEMERRLADPEFTKAMEYVQSADFFPARGAGLG
ncbi:hypothetical protein GCM10018980_18240 [Streptomyces capoamus]|uniref:Uncharacterized protein n=1 Tax=Streptomyces capoamus TaxID=68183 RepID=A0A919C278_9ACTN|nr:hypothetical protein GCM10010501_31860 [Streptomyces libani subsp. rufus]GHG42474.1 hypothetical protein GCM10018980_18240 [Streptomyces capoamus]